MDPERYAAFPAERGGRLREPVSTEDDVVAATGFSLVIPADVPTTRLPTDEELDLLDTVVDPGGLRHKEVPEA